MTPEHRRELREWSARLMGWYLQDQMVMINSGKEVSGYFDKNGLVMYQHDWTPDLPSATASQILGVIERMKRLGYFLKYDNEVNDATFYSKQKNKVGAWAEGNIFPEVVLEAAWATEVGR